MDNTSYRCVAADGSIFVKAMTIKRKGTGVLDRYNVPYRTGQGVLLNDNKEQLDRNSLS